MIIILEIAKYASAVIVIATALGLFIKWAIVKPIKSYIEYATYPIQPHANGGRSLPDLVDTVNDLKIMLVGHIKDHDTP